MTDDYVAFHIRQRDSGRSETPVLYDFNSLPTALRHQIVAIVNGAVHGELSTGTYVHMSSEEPTNSGMVEDRIWRDVCEEIGIPWAPSSSFEKFNRQLTDSTPESLNLSLTAIEVVFRHITSIHPEYSTALNCRYNALTAVKQLNKRFQQNGVGYAFEGDRIIRVDSQYVHSQIVDPALQLLTDAQFLGAQKQFLKAHEHFKEGKNDDAILNAGRAFESTLKHICDEMEWEYGDNASAVKLIKTVSDRGLFPKWHDAHLGALGALLTGLPTSRNKLASHGKTSADESTDHSAKLALNLCATNIVFAVDAYNHLHGPND